ncbi:hypothetical protein C8R43DRAFT_152254 [Mycena crocata]|nr:hypothetical protein C8R43DRAFT_152254 [Mycena crocata]
MAPNMKELLQEPFGPYPDSVMLDSRYQPKGTNLPQLRRLKLLREGKVIGLDESERYLDPPPTASRPVVFLGVLIIEDLKWLSSTGRALLESDLNERDATWPGQRFTDNSKKTTKGRELTLGVTYRKGLKITVWVRCEKETPAMFRTADAYPNSLLLNSEDEHRCYEILSMDHPIYDLSRNFLERYRLVALIKEIMANPEYNLTPNCAEVDILVEAYLRRYKEDKEWSHSIIFANPSIAAPEEPLLRHVPHAEVRGIFAAHSAWLLAFYLRGPRVKCPIDIRAWCEFITKVRAAKASRKSGNWSRTREDDEIWASDDENTPAAIAKTLEKFGGTAAEWEKRLQDAITKSPSRYFEDDDEEPRSKRPRLTYDSDFSELSTPGCSESETETETNPPPLSFPREFWPMSQLPTLHPGRFIWDCPIRKCEYFIDLLNLSQEETDTITEQLGEEYSIYIQNRQYENLGDENLQRAFGKLVSHHYCSHLGMNSADLARRKKHFKEELRKKWRFRRRRS